MDQTSAPPVPPVPCRVAGQVAEASAPSPDGKAPAPVVTEKHGTDDLSKATRTSSASDVQIPPAAPSVATSPVAKTGRDDAAVVTPAAKHSGGVLQKQRKCPEMDSLQAVLSNVIAENTDTARTLVRGYVALPSVEVGSLPQVSTFETARMTAQSDNPTRRPPVKRKSSNIMRGSFIKKNTRRQLEKTMMACLPVKVENGSGRIVVEFGGYTRTAEGGVEPRPVRLHVKRDLQECKICGDVMKEQPNLCVVVGCFHMYHRNCAFRVLGCPYYRTWPYEPGKQDASKDPSNPSIRTVDCKDCLKEGARFMFGHEASYATERKEVNEKDVVVVD